MSILPVVARDRTDAEVADEIEALVARYGLHSNLLIAGVRCCTMDELRSAALYEARQRREHNITNMIITTGAIANPPGVFLPPAPDK